MSKVSVIVPVYKVENYISRCLNSIANQSFKDFDLFLVDDGSADGCPSICDEFSLANERSITIHKKNGGLSDARNKGIDLSFAVSDSKYITFLDSDDWVNTFYLEFLYCAIEKNGISVSATKHKQTNGENVSVDIKNASPKIIDVQDYYINDYTQFITAWGKMFLKNDFLNVRFPYGRLHEDEFTTWKIIFKYNKVALIDEPLYSYFSNKEGIMNSAFSIRREDGLIAQKERLEYLENMPGMEKIKEKTIQIVACTMAGYIEIIDNIEENPEFYKYKKKTRRELKTFLIKYRKQVPFRGFGWAYGKAYPRLIKLMIYYFDMLDKLKIVLCKKKDE